MQSPPRLVFRCRLKQFRRRILVSRLPLMVLKTFEITCSAAVPMTIAVRLDLCDRNAFLLLLPVVMSAFLFSLWKYHPGLGEGAAVFDRYANRKSLAVNAFEIIDRGAPETPFTAFAVSLAAAALREWRGKIPVSPDIRKWDLIPMVLAAAVLICPLPHGKAGNPQRVAEAIPDDPKNESASQRMAWSADRSRKQTASNRNIGKGAGDRRKSGSGRQGSRGIGQLQMSEKNSQRDGSARSGGDSGGKDCTGERKPAESDSGSENGNPISKQEKQQPGNGINGSGGMSDDDESGTGTETAAGSGGDSSSHSAGERRKKEVNRKKAKTRGGFQPLPPDNAPQAGRKLADGDKQGNDPGSGRGGETDAKKSRGAAAMLPVIPQPDMVVGRLGSGEDITSISRSASGSGGQTGQSLGNPGYPETAGRHFAVPAGLRRKIRRELEKTIILKEDK